MTRHRLPILALGAAVLLAGCGFGAFANHNGVRGLRIDDRDRNDAVCGTGDDNNQCQGALTATIVPNPKRREYVVMWQGWYSSFDQDGINLYERRLGASTGQPKGPSVELARNPRGYQFAATYDPTTRTYALAWQRPTDPYASVHSVAVQRFDEALQPTGPAIELSGNWLLMALAAESRGRLAVIGVENDRVSLASPVAGPLGLHVETIDANGNTLSVTNRDTGAVGLAASAAAVYDWRTHNLLVAWIPVIANQGAEAVRVDQIDRAGGGRVVTLPLSPTAPAGQANLACNGLRRDCLLIYAGGGPSLGDLHAHLLAPDGQPQGPSFEIAADTGGPIGMGPTGNGYAFAWNQGGVIAPIGSHVIVARLTGAAPRVTKLLDQKLPGEAQFAGAENAAAGLLIWRPPVSAGGSFSSTEWFQIRGQVVPLTTGG